MSYALAQYFFARDMVWCVMQSAPGWKEPPNFLLFKNEGKSYFNDNLMELFQTVMRKRLDSYSKSLEKDLYGRPFTEETYKEMIKLHKADIDQIQSPLVHFFEFCMRATIYAFLLYKTELIDVSKRAVQFIFEEMCIIEGRRLITKNSWVEVFDHLLSTNTIS